MRSVLAVALVIGIAAAGVVPAAADGNFPGAHGEILVLPEPQTAPTRGSGFGGSVFFSGSSMFPAVLNVANVVQTTRTEGVFDLPITLLQRDDWDNDAIDVEAKGTWLEPKIIVTHPVMGEGSRTYKGRGVILGQIDYVSYQSELDGKGKGNNPDTKITVNHQAAVVRGGFAYGVLDTWALGGGVRFLGYHKPEGEIKVNKNKLTTEGDPGGGLFAVELGTLVKPIDDLHIGVSYEVGAADNPKIKIKGKAANGAKVDTKDKIYRVFPPRFNLGVAYIIRSANNLQLVGDYWQQQNLEKDDTDLCLRRQTIALGAIYPLDKMWTLRGGINKLDESGDGKLNLLGLTAGAGADVSKELDVDFNLGYFTGKEEVDDEDAKYQDIRIGGQAAYRFK
ncbi:MAG: hypothetical protein M5R36_29510 [Deltaproteobacteria bacterium]|nr:hypothetical protein [Deltaproteobacteria bacterium]